MNYQWAVKLLAALIPVLLGALVTIAWQNSHRLAVLTAEVANVEQEMTHLRTLVEDRLIKPPPQP
jgi:hypothetical protein